MLFYPMQKGRGEKLSRAVKVGKLEELRGSVFLSSSGAPSASVGSRDTRTVRAKTFENILKLPLKRENGTFTLVSLHLMALPEMPCPPWAIN